MPIFPVMWFKEGMFGVFKTADEMTTCDTLGLLNGFYSALRIVDVQGECYTVKGARKIKGVSPFWGWRLFERLIKVELNFEATSVCLSLEEFKALICKTLGQDPLFWSSPTGSHENIKQEVCEKDSFQSIIDLPYFQ